nr:hypothetical protein [Tanacetum cinerariifolium]
MLDKTHFTSWKRRIQLYCRGKENQVNIVKSIDEGPFQLGIFRETLTEGDEGALHLGLEKPQVYSDLSSKEKERYKTDIRATNISLQGLPKDIYTLINHYADAKDIWDNVKMLMEGSELTKEDRESQLYDDFEHFYQNKGETIQDYYVQFANLINDMQNIKMTIDLRDSNYDQLYAYLNQNEAHANKNKMMLDQFTQHNVDPLALMSNVSHQQNQATVQDDKVVVQNVQGRLNRGHGNNAKRTCVTGHIARNCTQPKRTQNSDYFKDKMLLMQAQENGVALDEEQLLFIAANKCDAFDYDVDAAPTAQTMFMANRSSADPVYDEAGLSYDSDFYLSDRYKNPLYLSKAKQVQPALYSGQEIVKSNHARVLVQDLEDTLEIAKTTKKRMNGK